MFRKALLIALLLGLMVSCAPFSLTPAPTATEAPVATEAPAIVEPTFESSQTAIDSVKFTVFSLNMKRFAQLVANSDTGEWDLVVDDIVIDTNVDESQPIWSPDSKGIIIATSYGVCYYNVEGKVVGPVSPFCYTQTSPTSLNFVSNQYGANIWFVSGGNIYSGTAGDGKNAEKFVTKTPYVFTHVSLTQNGYYMAGTVETGDLAVYETSGKFIRLYKDLTNATWSIRSMLAGVRQVGNGDTQIVFIDITTKIHETFVDTGSLRPGNLSYSSDGYKLTFSSKGVVYWVRLADGIVFTVSDPNASSASNPSWKGGFIVYDECLDGICSTKMVEPKTTIKWED